MGGSFSLFNILKLRDIVRFVCQRAIQPNERFLSVYDNGNSVWENNEIQHIRRDYNNGKLNSIYANYLLHSNEEQDVDYEDNYLLKKTLDNLTPEESEKLAQITVLNSKTAGLDNKLLTKIAKSDDKRFNKLKEYLLDRNKQINVRDIEYLLNLEDEDFEIAEKYIYIEKRGKNQLDGSDIINMLMMDKEEREQIDKYLAIDGRDDQLELMAIRAVENLPDEEKKFMENILKLKNSDGSDRFKAYEFSILPFEDFTHISNTEDLLYIEGRGKNQFALHDLLKFSMLGEKERARLRQLVYVEERKGAQFSASDILALLKLSDDELAKVREYFYIENAETQYSGADLVNIARLEKKDLKRLEPFMYISEREENQFSGEDLVNFANLSNQELRKLKKYACLEERDFSPFSGDDLLEMVKMPKKTLEQLEPFFSLPISWDQPTLKEVKELYSLFNNDFGCMYDLIVINPDISAAELIHLGRLCSLNKEMVLQVYSNHVNATVCNDELVDYDNDKNKIFTYNAKLNSTNLSCYKLKNGIDVLTSQTIKKYDSDNNLVEVRQLKQGGIAGIPNITVMKNGEVIPVPNSDSLVISNNFVSPGNIKTDYYIEQTTDGITIINYTIIDGNKENNDEEKENAVLLDRQLTIQRIAEDRFITSVKNDKSYDITLEEDKLIVKNIETGVIKNIDISSLAVEEESKKYLMEILTSVPGNILDIISSDRMTFEFNDEEAVNNGGCGVDGDKVLITMGTQLYASSEDNSLAYAFLHELGHMLDIDFDNKVYGVISNNKELLDVYKKEYAAFIQNTDSIIQRGASYIVNDLSEIVAEVNMLLNGMPDLLTAERVITLQEYFPETIALIAKLLDERINNLYEAELQNNKDAQ